MADGIVGNKFEHYPKEIKQGIHLHRAIDTFTDSHDIVKQSKRRLHERYKHYKGVIIDIFYDHFLAKNWTTYSDVPLAIYVDEFYDLLEAHFDILPLGTKRMMPYMIADNWLLSYQSIEGITRVLEGMNRRTKNKSQMNLAVNELQEFYNEFETEFTAFFDELTTFSKHKLIELNNDL